MGTAYDLWTAIRDSILGEQARPFIGWIMVVEDSPKSRCAVKEKSPHYDVFTEFKGSSYLQLYDVLCQKMMREQLYTQACVLATPREAASDGRFEDLSTTTSLKAFVAGFAAHIAGWTAAK